MPEAEHLESIEYRPDETGVFRNGRLEHTDEVHAVMLHTSFTR